MRQEGGRMKPRVAYADFKKPWTLVRLDREHSYVLEGEKWIATATNELAQKIADDHNREAGK
jgi:hypothetical protein